MAATSNKDSLLHLVDSLTASEKRYFKLYVERQGKGASHKYMEVFKILEDSSGKSAKDVNTMVQQVTGTKQASRLKTYLKQLILKSLVSYNAESDCMTRIREHLSMVEVLAKKRLIGECYHQLDKAEKIAQENEAFLALMEINHFRLALKRFHLDHEGLVSQLSDLRQTARENMEKWINLMDHESQSILWHSKTKKQGHWGDLENTFQLDAPKSVRAELLAMRLQGSQFMRSKSFANAKVSLLHQIALMEAHPPMIQARPAGYLSTLRNSMIMCRYAGEFNSAAEIGNKLLHETARLLGKKKKQDNINEHLASVNAMLDLFKDTGDSASSFQLIQEINPFLKKFYKYILPLHYVAFHYLKGLHFFLTGNFKAATKNFYWISLSPEGKVRIDLQIYSRLMLLLCYWETGQLETLHTELNRHSRYIQKKDCTSQLPHVLLALFQQLQNTAPESNDFRLALESSCKEMESLLLAPEERQAFFYFNFWAWGKSKLSRRFLHKELPVGLDTIWPKYSNEKGRSRKGTAL